MEQHKELSPTKQRVRRNALSVNHGYVTNASSFAPPQLPSMLTEEPQYNTPYQTDAFDSYQQQTFLPEPTFFRPPSFPSQYNEPRYPAGFETYPEQTFLPEPTLHYAPGSSSQYDNPYTPNGLEAYREQALLPESTLHYPPALATTQSASPWATETSGYGGWGGPLGQNNSEEIAHLKNIVAQLSQALRLSQTQNDELRQRLANLTVAGDNGRTCEHIPGPVAVGRAPPLQKPTMANDNDTLATSEGHEGTGKEMDKVGKPKQKKKHKKKHKGNNDANEDELEKMRGQDLTAADEKADESTMVNNTEVRVPPSGMSALPMLNEFDQLENKSSAYQQLSKAYEEIQEENADLRIIAEAVLAIRMRMWHDGLKFRHRNFHAEANKACFEGNIDVDAALFRARVADEKYLHRVDMVYYGRWDGGRWVSQPRQKMTTLQTRQHNAFGTMSKFRERRFDWDQESIRRFDELLVQYRALHGSQASGMDIGGNSEVERLVGCMEAIASRMVWK